MNRATRGVVFGLRCAPVADDPLQPLLPQPKLTNDADLQLLASLPKDCPVFRGCLDPGAKTYSEMGPGFEPDEELYDCGLAKLY
ncbi:MAG TPA: hypothetical protein VMT78_14550, partial [Terriglobia bacterium]|nr:hypothetical protein [Terriglobia bacterium]